MFIQNFFFFLVLNRMEKDQNPCWILIVIQGTARKIPPHFMTLYVTVTTGSRGKKYENICIRDTDSSPWITIQI